MAYSRLNLLKRVRDIQKIAQDGLDDERKYKWIWKNKIYPTYKISYQCFLDYCNMPRINEQINILERLHEEKKKQMDLF